MDEGRKGIARDASGLEGPERWIGELPAIDKTKKTMKNAVCFQPSAINITRWVPCGARRGLNAARKADTTSETGPAMTVRGAFGRRSSIIDGRSPRRRRKSRVTSEDRIQHTRGKKRFVCVASLTALAAVGTPESAAVLESA